MNGYQVVFEHEVLFRDLDAMGHVNNVAYIAIMEDARMKYWKVLRKKHGLRKIYFILAELTCRYHTPAYLGETLLTGIRVRALGEKSFHFEYRMQDRASGRLVTEGRSVQVMYDYKQQQSVPINEPLRRAVELVEQLPLAELTPSPDG
jgi:acyl-CoA thioester hydrolase